MRPEELFQNEPYVLPNDPSMKLIEHFDAPEQRESMELAHRVIEHQIADLAAFLETHKAILDIRTKEKFLGEVNGLCSALRSISGSKYWMVNFIDPKWIAAHRSQR